MTEKKPLKICMIYRRSFPEEIGGSHRYFYELAINMARRGHEVHVIYCTFHHKNAGDLFEHGVHWHRYHVRRTNPISDNCAYMQKTFEIALRILKERGIDVINYHGPRAPQKIFSSLEFKDVAFVYLCQADTAFEMSS